MQNFFFTLNLFFGLVGAGFIVYSSYVLVRVI